MAMEVDNLIQFTSEGDQVGADGGGGQSAAHGGGGRDGRPLGESAQPPLRRLLLKAGTSPQRLFASPEHVVTPKRSGALQSLGDDTSFLDAIIGNILQGSVVGDDSVESLVLNETQPQPSAPPMEQHWEAPGPSGCPATANPDVRPRPSSPSSSTCSSTLSLRQLDVILDEAAPDTPHVLNRGGVRATVIGGLPIHRRCRCPGETIAEVSCAAFDGRFTTDRVSSSFRRPRSADTALGRAQVDANSPSLESAHQQLSCDAVKRQVQAGAEVTSASTGSSPAPPLDDVAARQSTDVSRTLDASRSPVDRRQSPIHSRLQPRPHRRPPSDRNRPQLFVVPASPVDPPSPIAVASVPPSPSAPPLPEGDMEGGGLSPLGQWPHTFSNTLACLACTLGIFNISRFAILSVQFGANFIIQFFVMSVILGIPLFTFHVALGQLLGAGTMDMWKISPIFQGIGVALILSQALLGIYSIVGVSWMLVYFRDSFITKHDTYRWAEPYLGLIGSPAWRYNSTTFRLEETVADYFSGTVLQRINVENPANSPGTLKFQLTFNLAVVWMIVFIALSKGLKSYGKVVFLFSLVPILGMIFLCVKIMGLAPSYRKSSIILPETDWSEFFLNSKSWSMAMTEAFYTWGLLGASAMQMASHNRPNHILHKDTNIVTAVTFGVLILSAFLANTCSQLLLAHGYLYTPSSFERASTYGFLQPLKSWPQTAGSTPAVPVRWMPHNLYLAGDKVMKPGANLKQQSGYQALRLATELMPATLAVLGSDRLSPFWSVLFYFIFILFGIAQQLAIMHSIITGIMAIKIQTMKSWETTITFFACVCGFFLGLPMATELGIFVLYFLDVCVGGAWWIVLLYLIELIVVFMVRGRPYSGETVVAELFKKAGPALQNLAAPVLSFTWNVILPVILMVQSVSVFKSGNYRDFFKWGSPMNYDYWPSWSRNLGSMIQLGPLMAIPIVALFQTCRYLSKGPPDIFDRIQLLYRPPEEAMVQQSSDSEDTSSTGAEVEVSTESAPPATLAPPEDPPPKYTPPPSYTTATGARIAKMLRQSFRRSIRRLTNSGSSTSTDPANTASARAQPPPPDYATVLVEINQSASGSASRDAGVSSNSAEVFSAQSTSPFAHVSTLVRNSFRRAMRDGIAQSTSSEVLVDSEAPTNRDLIIPNHENDKTVSIA